MPHVTGHFCVCHVELWLLFHDFYPCTQCTQYPVPCHDFFRDKKFGFLDKPGTQVPRYLGTQVPGYPGTWVPGYLGTWVPGKTRTFLFAKTRTLFRDNTYTFCVRVIANRKKKYTWYRNLPKKKKNKQTKKNEVPPRGTLHFSSNKSKNKNLRSIGPKRIL